MTNPAKAPHEQQPQHQAPVNARAAEDLLTDFGQPQEQQLEVPAPTISQPVFEGDQAPTDQEEVIPFVKNDRESLMNYLRFRGGQLPTLMGYSIGAENYLANPKENPRPRLFLDDVSPEERQHLTPGDIQLLPEDLIPNVSDDFIDTLPPPVQAAWREEAAKIRDDYAHFTPQQVRDMVSDGQLHEIPDELAQLMPEDAQRTWEKATGRSINATPFHNTFSESIEATELPAAPEIPVAPKKRSRVSRFLRRGGKGATTAQEAESGAADNPANDVEETAPAEPYAFSEADGVTEGHPFYGKTSDDLRALSNKDVNNMSQKEYDEYARLEDIVIAHEHPDREMVGPESDPSRLQKAAALVGKVASKLTFRRGDRGSEQGEGDQGQEVVTSENHRVSEEDAEGLEFLVGMTDEQLLNGITVEQYANLPDDKKDVVIKLQVEARARRDAEYAAAQEAAEADANKPKLRHKLGKFAVGVGQALATSFAKDEKARANGEQGEQQPKRPIKERAKELADKIAALPAGVVASAKIAKGQVDLLVMDALLGIPKFGAKLQEKFAIYTEDPLTGERVPTARTRAAAAVGLLLVAAGTYFSIKHAIDGISGDAAPSGAGNAMRDTGDTAANQPGVAGTSSSATEVTTTTTGAPSSSEAADAATTTTGTPSSSTEVDTTSTGTPSSSSTEQATTTTTGKTIVDDRQPHNGGNGSTATPETPDTSNTPGAPDQSANPNAPQAPDTRGMDQVADPTNQPAYSVGSTELQPGGNVWDSSEQYWVDRGFTGSQGDLDKLTDALKDWRLKQPGLKGVDPTQMAVGTKMPMPTPEQISEIIAKSGV